VIQGTSGPLHHVKIQHYRYADSHRRSLGKSAGDTWVYLPARRRIRRVTTDFHASVVPGTDLTLEDLPDFPLAVTAHRFRCLGRAVRLAPFAPAPWVPGDSPPPPPGKGLPDVEMAPRPRFEARRTVALEAIPRAEGAAYARRILHLDAQTLRPIYRIDLDAGGEPTRVVANTYLWSGDDPEGSPGWPGVPEPRTLLPFRSVALDLRSDVRTRIDFGRVRSHPLPSKGRIRRLIDLTRSRCVAAGTPIATPAGPRPIETLRPGDPVWSYDRTRERVVEARVASVESSSAELTLHFAGGLRVTPDHPLLASGAWVEAGEVAPDAELLRRDGTRVRAGHPETVEGRVRVFDLAIDGPHNFFAADRLVHNKSR